MNTYSTKRTIIKTLTQAASIRSMGTDTLEGLRQIDADIEHRAAQIDAGLITLDEAKTLIAQG